MSEPVAITRARELITLYDECCAGLSSLGFSLSGIHGVRFHDRCGPRGGYALSFDLAGSGMRAMVGLSPTFWGVTRPDLRLVKP